MSVLGLSSVSDGFAWVEGMREWRVEGTLEAKLGRWHEEDRLERRRWADDSMAVSMAGTKTPMDCQKRARKTKRYLRSLLVSGRHAPVRVSKQRSHPSRSRKHVSI